MKCLILAGGRGERLWPLSRKNYPKQFIQVQKNHSVFQETVLRNIPFCDEFIIVTNYEYRHIVANQMEAFQGISYRCVLEEEPLKTTAAVLLACLDLQPSEYIFVVASDHLIDTNYETKNGELSYRDAIVRAKDYAKDGSIVLFGLPEREFNTKFGYITGIDSNGNIKGFLEKPSNSITNRLMALGGVYRNLGLCLFRNASFQNELQIYAEDVYNQCVEAYKEKRIHKSHAVYSKELQDVIEPIAIEKSLFEKSKNIKAVKTGFCWSDIGRLEDLTKTELKTEGVCIKKDCNNTVVINNSAKQAVVVNELDDVMVVNTADAVYVGKYGTSAALKDILHENPTLQSHADKGLISYRPWGFYEQLEAFEDYRIRRVTLAPGKTIYAHQHMHRSETWTIVKGSVLMTIDGECQTCSVKDSIHIPEGTLHQVSNIGEEEAVFIETAVGVVSEETDMVSEPVEDIAETKLGFAVEDMIKVTPIFRDYLWGGTKLRDVYHMNCDYDVIAESWQVSAHNKGQSIIASGKHKGMRFGDYLELVGKDALGWKCGQFQKFPLMIKFIDARENLSVQVHPDDDYAMVHENEYGKNEMWYVIDAEPGAGLYIGFDRDVDAEEVKRRVADNTITEILNFYPTKAGDVFFIPAGTVHAIGAGNLICEIQQSSNAIYRLYDYNRLDKFGNARELHLEKALEILDYKKYVPSDYEVDEVGAGTVLSRCKYFEAVIYHIEREQRIRFENDRFHAVVCINGNGLLKFNGSTMPIEAGESVFVPAADGMFAVEGALSIIVSYI